METSETYNGQYALTILLAMNRLGKGIYGGTADPVRVAKRRKANKVASRQRRVNRQRG